MEKLLDVRIKINNKTYEDKIESRVLLVDFIRKNAKLTGTHIGCDTSQCGSCIVHVNGQITKSCSLLAIQANNQNITTIEGIGEKESLHPMQKAFQENHGLQCGFCTPGMIMSAIELVNKAPKIDEKIIRKHIEGNMCRCTGYQNIVKSIKAGAEAMRS